MQNSENKPDEMHKVEKDRNMQVMKMKESKVEKCPHRYYDRSLVVGSTATATQRHHSQNSRNSYR